MFSYLISLYQRARVWGLKGIISYLIRQRHDVALRYRLYRNARRYPCETPERGITLIAPISGNYSLSKTVRDFAHALKCAGTPFQTFDTFCHRRRAQRSDYEDILTPENEFRVNRYSHIVEMFTSPLPGNVHRPRAAIAFWEGKSGMLEVFPYLADKDTVIAMSDFNLKHFREELPEDTPVVKILYPLLPPPNEMPPKSLTRRRFGIGEKDFAVFFNFDLGSVWRKNPEGTLRAFAAAFSSTSDAKLVFKTNGSKKHPDRLAALLALGAELGLSDRLICVNDYLSQSDLFALTAACDVYISLHRAEGFGLGVAEAMCFSKPVIVTDYSSTTEFCNSDNSIPIPYKLIPVEGKEYFANMGTWADADIDAAAAALRKLYDDQELREKLGRRAKEFIDEHFSLANFRKSVDAFLAC